MTVLLFRSILCESNPLVVREFTFDCDRSCDTFRKTLAILHQMEVDAPCLLMSQGHALKYSGYASLPLSSILPRIPDDPDADYADTGLLVCFHPSCISDTVELNPSDTTHLLTFAVEFCAFDAESFRRDYAQGNDSAVLTVEPCLISYCGFHPPHRKSSIAEINDWMSVMAKEQANRWLSHDYYAKERSMLTPSPEQINMTLFCTINHPERNITLREDALFPMEQGLQALTLEEIKGLCRQWKLNIRLNQRKSELVTCLAQALHQDSTIWPALLADLSMHEFLALYTYCSKEIPAETEQQLSDSDHYPILSSNHLLLWSSYQEHALFPEPFLRYIKKQVALHGLESITDPKAADGAIYLCSELYGLFTEEQFRSIYLLLAPNQVPPDFRSALQGTAFGDYRTYGAYTYESKKFNNSLLQNTEMRLMISRDLPYYIPTLEEAEQILTVGCIYSDESQKQLASALHSCCNYNCTDEEIVRVLPMIYCMQQLELMNDTIIRYLTSLLEHWSARKKAKDALESVLLQVGSQVRRYGLKGHTSDEYNEWTSRHKSKTLPKASTAAKIYPNSPCPCGSGKKYKFCHGRK